MEDKYIGTYVYNPSLRLEGKMDSLLKFNVID